MATEREHIDCANRTHKTIVHLLGDKDLHSPWIATAAFYKALQIVEAVFANNASIGHTSMHGDREHRLKTTQKYKHISVHYGYLSRASTKARCLSGVSCFDDHMSPEDVVNHLLKHHLRELEKSARKFLTDPTALIGIETAFE